VIFFSGATLQVDRVWVDRRVDRVWVDRREWVDRRVGAVEDLLAIPERALRLALFHQT
jgi:hypothetical protein